MQLCCVEKEITVTADRIIPDRDSLYIPDKPDEKENELCDSNSPPNQRYSIISDCGGTDYSVKFISSSINKNTIFI